MQSIFLANLLGRGKALPLRRMPAVALDRGPRAHVLSDADRHRRLAAGLTGTSHLPSPPYANIGMPIYARKQTVNLAWKHIQPSA